MTIDISFTAPTPEISAARVALARLGRHLDLVLGPLSESLLATDLTFAVLGLEDVHPPYPPLPEVDPSDDPGGDFAAAVHALLVASSQASTAADTLRYAYVLRDLRAMEAAPDFAAVLAADGSGR